MQISKLKIKIISLVLIIILILLGIFFGILRLRYKFIYFHKGGDWPKSYYIRCDYFTGKCIHCLFQGNNEKCLQIDFKIYK